MPFSWLVAGLIPDHRRLGRRPVSRLSHLDPAGVDCVALLLRCLAGLLPGDRRDRHHAGRRHGQGDSVALRRVAGRASGIASINLMAAGATASAGGAAADLLTDLKSGYILGANPRKQFLAQFFGVFFGTLAIVPAWFRWCQPSRPWRPSILPPRTCGKPWRTCSPRASTMLPMTAIWAIVIGAILGVAAAPGGKLFPKAQPFLPSAMGLGLSWVMVFPNSLSFAIGAVIVAVWNKLQQENCGALLCSDGFRSHRRRIARRRADCHCLHGRGLVSDSLTSYSRAKWPH